MTVGSDDILGWWLSFVDPDTDTFLGVAVIHDVDAFDIVTAAHAAWAAGCNPGGEVAGWPISVDTARAAGVPVGRLMGKAEALAAQRRITEVESAPQ